MNADSQRRPIGVRAEFIRILRLPGDSAGLGMQAALECSLLDSTLRHHDDQPGHPTIGAARQRAHNYK